MERRRILIITRNFPPLTGGMERFVYQSFRELQQEFDCDVIGPKGCKAFLDDGARGWECASRPLPLFLLQAARHAIRATGRHDYGLLLAGSGVTAPIAVRVARHRRIRSASFAHGLDLVAASRVYQRCFVPVFRQADLTIANSSNTRRLALDRGFSDHRTIVINPGVEIPSRLHDPEEFRRRFELGDGPILLAAGRIIPRKGLPEFIERSLPAVMEQCPDCTLVVVGSVPGHALKASDSAGARIEAAIARSGLRDNVRLVGWVDDATLDLAYCAADAFVFPVRGLPGDVEGFGMVALEAAAHGLPTVAFDVGGIADAVADGVSGHLVDAGDYPAMAAAILDLIGHRDKWSDGCRRHARALAWPKVGRRLREALRDLVAMPG